MAFDNAKTCVSQIEKEMNLEDGALQKCITIVHNEMLLDAGEGSDPRSADLTARIYSPTAPMYIDVHFQYYLRSRFSSVQWFYSLGFKIHRRPSATAGDASVIKKELRKAHQPDVHTRNGWQNLCWGYYDDSCDTKFGALLSVAKWSCTRRVFWTFTKRCLESWRNLLTQIPRPCSRTDDHSSEAYACFSPLSVFYTTLRALMMNMTNRRVT